MSKVSPKRLNEMVQAHRQWLADACHLAEIERKEAEDFIKIATRQHMRARSRDFFLPDWQLGGSSSIEESSPREDFERLLTSLNYTKIAFLHTDLEIGLTIAQMAVDAKPGSEKRSRNMRNARAAYDAVRRFRDKVVMTVEESRDLNERLSELRSTLARLGQ